MLAGLMSRCTSPASCAVSSASATRATTPAATSGASGPPMRSWRAEVRPAHEPHRHVGQVLDDAGLVDGDHAGVIERGGRARLAPEAFAEAGIDGAVGGDHLQRHVPLQPEVHGVVHHAHPAAAQGRDDPVPGELRSRLEVDAHGQRYSYAGGVWRRTPLTRARRRSCRPSSRRSAPTSRSCCTVTRRGSCGSSRSTPPRG